MRHQRELKNIHTRAIYPHSKIASFQGMTHRELQQSDLKLVAIPYTATGGIVIVDIILK